MRSTTGLGSLNWLVLLALLACEARAAPPSQPPAAAPQAAPKAAVSTAPNSAVPQAALKPTAAGPVSPDAYAALLDAMLLRDIFKLGKDAAQERFGKFIPLQWKAEDILAGGSPRDELEVTFTGCASGATYCVGTAELALFTDSEAEAVEVHRALTKRLQSKLGKIRKRYNEDKSTPRLVWQNGRDITVLLSARPSHRRQPGQWEVDVSLEAPEP